MQHFRTEINPVTGAREDFYWDDQQQALVQRTRHQIGDILEANKRRANATTDGRKFGTDNVLHHVADIPNALIVKFKKDHGIDVFDPNHKKRLLRLLDSPDYRYLKSTVAKLNTRRASK